MRFVAPAESMANRLFANVFGLLRLIRVKLIATRHTASHGASIACVAGPQVGLRIGTNRCDGLGLTSPLKS
jgi:hypothetical protein